MATIGGSLKTLNDWAKEVDPDGSVSAVAEVLSQENELIDAMLFKPGNLPNGEQVTIRTGLPTSYWRMVNAGVPTSKATSAQVTEQCAQLTARAQIDRLVADLNGNTNEYRMNENRSFIESMSQEMAQTMFYGSSANPEEFVGLANRYKATTDGNGQNILLAGGSGSDNSSIWLLGLGENAIYGVFPKGSKAGIQHEDLGLQDAFDSSNNRFRAYMDDYSWQAGLVVKDWRYGVRIANIDMSDLTGQTGTQELTDATLITKLMSRAIDRLPKRTGIKPVFCMNRSIASLLRVVAAEKSSSVLSIEEGLNQFGQTIWQTKFLGIPVLINDAISSAEALVA